MFSLRLLLSTCFLLSRATSSQLFGEVAAIFLLLFPHQHAGKCCFLITTFFSGAVGGGCLLTSPPGTSLAPPVKLGFQEKTKSN